MSQKFYDDNYGEYFERTAHLDPAPLCSLLTDELARRGVGAAGLSLLDIGCGSMRDSAYLAGLGFRVTAIDASFNLIDHSISFIGGAAPALFPACADALALPFRDAGFYCAFAQASLLHIPHALFERAISEARRVVKKGGLIYFSLKEGDGSAKDAAGREFSYHRDGAVRSAIERAGLSPVSFRRRETVDLAGGPVVWLEYLAGRE